MEKRHIVETGTEPRWAEPGLWIIIAGNLVPLVGVMFFGWEAFTLMLLFWCENVIVGVFTALRMLLARPRETKAWAAKAFLLPFFCVHYGIFTFVHGMFVISFFGRSDGFMPMHSGPGDLIPAVQEAKLGWAIAGIVASYAVYFFWDYLRTGDYRKATLPQIAMEPYGRVIVLHVAILLGGILLAIFNAPSIVLLLLVALKTALDVRRYRKDQRAKDNSRK
ncbi:MAG TPA: DUF6498-containing protein [Verrucomicrobiae bacterium]